MCCNLDAAVVILLHIHFQDDEMADRTQPISEPIAPPKKETAWERGLKLAREVSTNKILARATPLEKEQDCSSYLLGVKDTVLLSLG